MIKLTKSTVSKPEILLVGLFVLISLLLNLHSPLSSLSTGLDPSFGYGINQAEHLGKSFGNDFIATYGPLGYLVKNYLPQSDLLAHIWMLFYAAALGVGAYLISKRLFKVRKHRIISSLAIIYIFSIGYPFGPEWNYLSVFILYCSLYMLGRTKNKYFLGLLTIVAATFLFVKFTLGVAGLGIVLLLPITRDRFYSRSNRKPLAGDYVEVLGVYLIAAFIISRFLGIESMYQYLVTGWIMSVGFSSAMSYQLAGTFMATVACAMAIILTVAIFLQPVKFKALSIVDETAKFLFILPALFVVWKYAVARQDGHILRLAQIILPLLLLALITKIKNRGVIQKISIFILVLAAGVFVFISAPLNKLAMSSSIVPFIKSPITNLSSTNFLDYFQINKEKQDWTVKSREGLKDDRLPSNLRQIIGDNKVDVYPWESSIVAANDLNWDPRPSPYSFESYSPYFDNLNSNFYSTKIAPPFIVWHNEAGIYGIDARNILWDEPKTVRTILSHYYLVDSTDKFMVLKRKAITTERPLIRISKQTARWGEWIEVPGYPNNENLYLTAEYKKGKRLKLEESLLRAESVYTSIQYDDGMIDTYRVVNENLGQGMIISPLPDTWQSIVALYGQGAFNKKPTRIMFSSNPNYMKRASSIQLTWLTQ